MEPPIPLVRAAAALRAGEPGPSVEVERLCARIDRTDPVVRAFTPEPGRHQRLIAEARAVEDRYRTGERPPLYGVPVGIKDVIQVDGLPTHAGSALPPGVLAGPQAEVVDRLRAAGALVAGKTVTAEFAIDAPGPTRNPHDIGHTPGGSSSGSAAAVAAGLVPLAIGTQTVGSVIRPAAYCGVVGFRPTYGRIPTDGVLANAPTVDTIGTFTTDVAGAALAAGVLCDGWSAQSAEPGTPGWPGAPVLGVPAGPYLEQAGPLARAAFARQLDGLRECGLVVREVPLLSDFEDVVRIFKIVNGYELARVHAELFPRFSALYRQETTAAVRRGREIGAVTYAAALQVRSSYRHRLAERMTAEGIDLWATPAATGPAPLGLDSTGDATMSLPWSHAGLPAITLPAGYAPGGLPLGLQLVGAESTDERLLLWASSVEPLLRPAVPAH
ncbi:amidase [Kitasatospora sp. GP82]|uniref:amidase n=1 Tax=Kitasatospora sp. GP82 TaxID=3035089 RepID=UPI002473A61B|nr:amidase [Kitasatospora sp. GP82]MDH6128943.1 Asp-tRNA(Asn)/Glu-tRNA(Gln) amidotransferase A subunit family amidase [Kitasatospora sp. GP82]